MENLVKCCLKSHIHEVYSSCYHMLTKLQQVNEAGLAFMLALLTLFKEAVLGHAFSDHLLCCRSPGTEVRPTSLWSSGSRLQPLPSSVPGTGIMPPDVYLLDFTKIPLF